MKRPLVSVALLACSLALVLAATALPRGSATGGIREGGTFRVAFAGTFDGVDPALSNLDTSGAVLHATCAKLLNYPDRPPPAGLRAVPEVAARHPRVSGGGKVYTFTLRRGFRFSNGARLDARSFAHQISRILTLESDGVRYVRDIVGADDVLAGRASTPAGVLARGYRLVIRLTRPVADFPARLAMRFFCAVPPGLPADPEGARAYPGAGPYYVADYRPGRRVVLRRNRFYRGTRPQHVDSFVVDLGLTPTEVIDRIERGAADWGHFAAGISSERIRRLVQRYRINRSRLFRVPSPDLQFFVLNTSRPLFRNNVRLRRAINFAVDRQALARELGYLEGRPTDQYLPIGLPGFRDARIYPLTRPNVTRARALARNRLRGGKAVLYTCNQGRCLTQAQIVRDNLARIGLEVEIKAFPFRLLFAKVFTRNEPFDIAWTPGLVPDYSDPYAVLNVLLDGRLIGRPETQNVAYFDSPGFNRRLDRASRLSGAARYRAYGNLDVALARDAAPLVAYAVRTTTTFVSRRLDPRCRVLRPELDLAAVCLKRG